VRYSVRRLRKKFMNVPVAVCLWGGGDLAPMGEAARADATIGSLREALEFCTKEADRAAPRDAASPPSIVSVAG
jgi:hypothetical protein